MSDTTTPIDLRAEQVHPRVPVWPTPADLADAASELEVERAERAAAWDRARERVQHVRDLVRDDLGVMGNRHRLMHNVHELVAALDELERLEVQQ